MSLPIPASRPDWDRYHKGQSQREWSVFFMEQNGGAAVSQEQAFMDTWEWSQAVDNYNEMTLGLPRSVW